MGRKLKVVLSGIYYPMAILRYFEGALKRRDDLELITAGPFTGRKIPWKGGMLMEEKYSIRPDFVVPNPPRPRCPVRWIESRLPWSPDLWIQIDAGFAFTGRPVHGLNFIVGTDPHVLDYTNSRRDADLFFCMQKGYAKLGDIYLPYAYDPIWHGPLEKNQKPEWDVVLLGLHYEQRDLLVKLLRLQGISVKYDLGPAFAEARSIYGKARVGINWSSLEDVNARVFEIMGMGLPLVTNRLVDLDPLFNESEHYLGFVTAKQGVESVRTLLENPGLADQIAKAGRTAVEPHTWDARVERILSEAQNCGIGKS